MLRHTPEKVARLNKAVQRFNAPWITDIEKLNYVYRMARDVIAYPTDLNLQLLLEAVEDAEGMRKYDRLRILNGEL